MDVSKCGCDEPAVYVVSAAIRMPRVGPSDRTDGADDGSRLVDVEIVAKA